MGGPTVREFAGNEVLLRNNLPRGRMAHPDGAASRLDRHRLHSRRIDDCLRGAGCYTGGAVEGVAGNGAAPVVDRSLLAGYGGVSGQVHALPHSGNAAAGALWGADALSSVGMGSILSSVAPARGRGGDDRSGCGVWTVRARLYGHLSSSSYGCPIIRVAQPKCSRRIGHSDGALGGGDPEPGAI